MFFEKLLLKTKCINCGRFSGNGLCDGCANQFQNLPLPFCSICKSNKIENGICSECLFRKPLFINVSTLGVYNGLLKNFIYKFKYEGIKHFGIPLGKLLGEKLKKEINIREIDFVTSIPLHQEKIKSRGFNQSEIIAVEISRKIFRPYKEILLRNRNTQPQHSLSSEERQDNLKNAFSINFKKHFIHKNILLVDDIFTTGATIQEACFILKENGVKNIYVATIARSI